MVKKILALALCCLPPISQAAPGVAVGQVECAGGWWSQGPVQVRINYTLPAADIGLPGAVFLGAYNPYSGSVEAFLTADGWEPGSGQLPPAYSSHRDGIPASFSIVTPKPSSNLESDNPYSTQPFVGYEIWISHGVLTSEAEASVRRRRAALEASRSRLVEAGRWNARYDDPDFDDEFRFSLIQKNAIDNRARALVVPDFHCSSNN